jgi:hypothetical protein
MKRRTWAATVLLAGLAGMVALAVATAAVPPADGDAAVLRVGAMTTARAAHQATLLGSGRVLITGGCVADGCEGIVASAELYDPKTGEFRRVAPMAVARASHHALPLGDGRVLVTGGWSGVRQTASAEIYDPATDRWTPAGQMTEARASHRAVPLPDGRALIVGASADIYDPAAGTFTPVAGMRAVDGFYLAVALADGRVLVTGGEPARGQTLASAQIYDPTAGRFERTGDMATARTKHGAALLPDGRVLIVGGSDMRGDRRFATTEVYDPATGEFSPGPELGQRRHKIRDAVVVLPSGAVLVAGGASSAELLPPGGPAFVPVAGGASGPQSFATATVLPSGDVLVLGGYDDRIRVSAGAWVLRPEAVSDRGEWYE